MADSVVRNIRRRCIAIERAYNQGSAGPREIHAIDLSIANIRRVGDALSAETMQNIIQSLTDLRSVVSAAVASSTLHGGFYAADRLHSGMLGIILFLYTVYEATALNIVVSNDMNMLLLAKHSVFKLSAY